jgi:hypothetical protein
MKIVQWEEYKTNEFRRWDRGTESWVVFKVNALWRVYAGGKTLKEARLNLKKHITQKFDVS